MTTKVGLYKDPRNKRRPWVVRWFGEPNEETQRPIHYSQPFARKHDAERFRAAKQAELDRGSSRDTPKEISLGDFVDRILNVELAKRRPGTRGGYKLTLGQLVKSEDESTPLSSITRDAASAFINTRQRVCCDGAGFSEWTRKKYLMCARAAFSYAVKWGYISQNPFDGIDLGPCVPRPWHYLKPAEFQQLLEVISDARWRVFYLLAYTTGARFGELFNLTWADVDFERGSITVKNRVGSPEMPPFTVKNHESRKLLIPRQTIDALLAWQEEAPDDVPYILLTTQRWKAVREKWRLCRAGKQWKQNKKTKKLEPAEWENRYLVNNVRRDISLHVKKAKLKLEARLTVHSFRKAFGTNHALAGTPMHVLQQLLGHASIITTQEFYLQSPDANKREAVARYELLLDGHKAETCVGIAYGSTTPSPRKTRRP